MAQLYAAPFGWITAPNRGEALVAMPIYTSGWMETPDNHQSQNVLPLHKVMRIILESKISWFLFSRGPRPRDSNQQPSDHQRSIVTH